MYALSHLFLDTRRNIHLVHFRICSHDLTFSQFSRNTFIYVAKKLYSKTVICHVKDKLQCLKNKETSIT